MTTNNKQGRFRTKKVYFTQVSNTALRDNTLSLKAKGLYSLIQSYITIPEFDLYKGYLLKQCKEGKDAFQGAWTELKKAGYLKQYRLQDADGTFAYEYELLDEPVIELDIDKTNNIEPYAENPYAENPYAGFPCTENRGNKIDTYSNNTNKNNIDINNTKSSSSGSKKNVNNDDVYSNCSFEEEDCYKDLYNSYYERCVNSGYNISFDDIRTLFNLYNKTSVCQALEKMLRSFVTIYNPYGYIAKSIENKDKKDNIYIGYKEDDYSSNSNSTTFDIEKELGYL